MMQAYFSVAQAAHRRRGPVYEALLVLIQVSNIFTPDGLYKDLVRIGVRLEQPFICTIALKIAILFRFVMVEGMSKLENV